MAPLPKERVEPGEPFENTGVDAFGPFNVKFGRRASEKRWILIFTCFTTRAIHLELVNAMSSSAMLNALVRFASRRPGVKNLWSDCATNFVGANNIIGEAVETWNSSSTAGVKLQEMKWSFLPPLAHHRAGVWERMIKSVKKHMTSIMGRETVDADVLATVTAQVEAIVNFRPITKVSDDPKDFESISPAQIRE